MAISTVGEQRTGSLYSAKVLDKAQVKASGSSIDVSLEANVGYLFTLIGTGSGKIYYSGADNALRVLNDEASVSENTYTFSFTFNQAVTKLYSIGYDGSLSVAEQKESNAFSFSNDATIASSIDIGTLAPTITATSSFTKKLDNHYMDADLDANNSENFVTFNAADGEVFEGGFYVVGSFGVSQNNMTASSYLTVDWSDGGANDIQEGDVIIMHTSVANGDAIDTTPEADFEYYTDETGLELFGVTSGYIRTLATSAGVDIVGEQLMFEVTSNIETSISVAMPTGLTATSSAAATGYVIRGVSAATLFSNTVWQSIYAPSSGITDLETIMTEKDWSRYLLDDEDHVDRHSVIFANFGFGASGNLYFKGMNTDHFIESTGSDTQDTTVVSAIKFVTDPEHYENDQTFDLFKEQVVFPSSPVPVVGWIGVYKAPELSSGNYSEIELLGSTHWSKLEQASEYSYTVTFADITSEPVTEDDFVIVAAAGCGSNTSNGTPFLVTDSNGANINTIGSANANDTYDGSTKMWGYNITDPLTEKDLTITATANDANLGVTSFAVYVLRSENGIGIGTNYNIDTAFREVENLSSTNGNNVTRVVSPAVLTPNSYTLVTGVITGATGVTTMGDFSSTDMQEFYADKLVGTTYSASTYFGLLPTNSYSTFPADDLLAYSESTAITQAVATTGLTFYTKENLSDTTTLTGSTYQYTADNKNWNTGTLTYLPRYDINAVSATSDGFVVTEVNSSSSIYTSADLSSWSEESLPYTNKFRKLAKNSTEDTLFLYPGKNDATLKCLSSYKATSTAEATYTFANTDYIIDRITDASVNYLDVYGPASIGVAAALDPAATSLSPVIVSTQDVSGVNGSTSQNGSATQYTVDTTGTQVGDTIIVYLSSANSVITSDIWRIETYDENVTLIELPDLYSLDSTTITLETRGYALKVNQSFLDNPVIQLVPGSNGGTATTVATVTVQTWRNADINNIVATSETVQSGTQDTVTPLDALSADYPNTDDAAVVLFGGFASASNGLTVWTHDILEAAGYTYALHSAKNDTADASQILAVWSGSWDGVADESPADITMASSPGAGSTRTIFTVIIPGTKVQAASAAISKSVPNIYGNKELALPTLLEDDVVFLSLSILADSDLTLSLQTAGYTKIDEVASQTYYTPLQDKINNFAVFYKAMGATPDTSVEITGTGSYDDYASVQMLFLRNLNTASLISDYSSSATSTVPGELSVSASDVIMSFSSIAKDGIPIFKNEFVGESSSVIIKNSKGISLSDTVGGTKTVFEIPMFEDITFYDKDSKWYAVSQLDKRVYSSLTYNDPDSWEEVINLNLQTSPYQTLDRIVLGKSLIFLYSERKSEYLVSTLNGASITEYTIDQSGGMVGIIATGSWFLLRVTGEGADAINKRFGRVYRTLDGSTLQSFITAQTKTWFVDDQNIYFHSLSYPLSYLSADAGTSASSIASFIADENRDASEIIDITYFKGKYVALGFGGNGYGVFYKSDDGETFDESYPWNLSSVSYLTDTYEIKMKAFDDVLFVWNKDPELRTTYVNYSYNGESIAPANISVGNVNDVEVYQRGNDERYLIAGQSANQTVTHLKITDGVDTDYSSTAFFGSALETALDSMFVNDGANSELIITSDSDVSYSATDSATTNNITPSTVQYFTGSLKDKTWGQLQNIANDNGIVRLAFAEQLTNSYAYSYNVTDDGWSSGTLPRTMTNPKSVKIEASGILLVLIFDSTSVAATVDGISWFDADLDQEISIGNLVLGPISTTNNEIFIVNENKSLTRITDSRIEVL